MGWEEKEIEALNNSPFVKLARKAQRNMYMSRQRVYQLRWLDKRGRELAESGITMEMLQEQAKALRDDMKYDDPDYDVTP